MMSNPSGRTSGTEFSTLTVRPWPMAEDLEGASSLGPLITFWLGKTPPPNIAHG